MVFRVCMVIGEQGSPRTNVCVEMSTIEYNPRTHCMLHGSSVLPACMQPMAYRAAQCSQGPIHRRPQHASIVAHNAKRRMGEAA